MALFKLGGIITALSGKLGGMSISNRGITTVGRNITQSNKAASPKQSLQRAKTAAIASSWGALTQTQRDTWIAAASNYTYVNRVGDTVTRNGYQTFSFVNQNLTLLGVANLTTAPAYVGVFQPKIFVSDMSSGNFEIKSNNASSDYYYAMYGIANMPNGVKPQKGKYRYIGYVTAAQLASGYDIISDLEAVFGTLSFPNNMAVYIKPINNSTGNAPQNLIQLTNNADAMVLEFTVGDGDSVTMPFVSGGTYSGSINWGDGTVTTFSAYNSAGVSHTYTNGGVYTVQIFGTFTHFATINGDTNDYLTDIMQFGSNAFDNLSFWGSYQLVDVTCSDTPVLNSGCDCSRLFEQCISIASWANLANWDMTNVGDLSLAFSSSGFGALDLSNWVLSSVTSLNQTFPGKAFTLDVSNWDVSNCTTFLWCFLTFSGSVTGLENWTIKTSGTINMAGMFQASSIDVDAGSWDISNVNNMSNWSNGGNLSNANWDSCLIGWDGLSSPPSGIVITVNATHTAAANSAYTSLTTTHLWTINEGV